MDGLTRQSQEDREGPEVAIGSFDLAANVQLACAGANVEQVAACLLTADGCQWVEWPPVATVPAGASRTVRVGCLAKVLTAALVSQRVAAGDWDLDGEIGGLSEWGSTSAPGVDAVTLRQLLTHTHGLDTSALPAVPKTRAGRVDLKSVTAAAQRAGPLFAPGALASYGNAGAWICAALLERHYRESYGRLLREHLFEPLDLSADLTRWWPPMAPRPRRSWPACLVAFCRASRSSGFPAGRMAQRAHPRACGSKALTAMPR